MMQLIEVPALMLLLLWGSLMMLITLAWMYRRMWLRAEAARFEAEWDRDASLGRISATKMAIRDPEAVYLLDDRGRVIGIAKEECARYRA